MTFADFVPIILIVLCLGAVIFYLMRQRKKGRKCIGCPYCDSCPSAKNGGCSREKSE